MTSSRILLAGMNNYRWRSYQECLRGDGFDARLVFSGVECVTALRDFRPDVLVLEPNILWGSGDGVLAARDDEPELQDNLVMILTAGCEPSLLYRMSDYSIDDLVWQPISAPALQRRLESLCEFRGKIARRREVAHIVD